VRKPLPLNVPVIVDYTADKPGVIAFRCGMNMVRGTIVVQ
jgi:plastocyanin domain-containing protein